MATILPPGRVGHSAFPQTAKPETQAEPLQTAAQNSSRTRRFGSVRLYLFLNLALALFGYGAKEARIWRDMDKASRDVLVNRNTDASRTAH